jgi:hypothetical protein
MTKKQQIAALREMALGALPPAPPFAAEQLAGFPFSKPSNLPLAFPASAAGAGQPIPNVLRRDVQLVHQAFGPAEHSNGYAAFTFSGPAGSSTAVLSETPPNRCQYYQAFDALHDDPIARVIAIFIREVNTGFTVVLQSSLFDGAGASVAAGFSYPIRRPLWVPEGFALGASTVAIGAPNIITLRGVTVVVNPAETPPPLF